MPFSFIINTALFTFVWMLTYFELYLFSAKEELMQFEDLKIKFQQEYNMKEEEVDTVNTIIRKTH